MDNKFVQWNTAKWWTYTWSPMVGCHKISPACQNCWAEFWAKRFHQSFAPHKGSHKNAPRHGQCFMGPVTDLFGDWRTTEDMGNDIIHAATRGWDTDATYLWLTKRVGNMCDALKLASRTIKEHWFRNHYFGYTAENQECYDQRLSEWTKSWTNPLDHINGWLSCEPLLGPLNLHFYTYWNIPKWLVVGSESGPNRRPCKIEWVESIVEQCMTAGVPVFVKQICLPNGRFTNKIDEFPEHLRIRQVPWAKEGEGNAN